MQSMQPSGKISCYSINNSLMPKVYDSEDPDLPNLPDRDEVEWSDYEFMSDSSSSTPSNESIRSEPGSSSIEEPAKAAEATGSRRRRSSKLSGLLDFRRHRASTAGTSRRNSFKKHDLFEHYKRRESSPLEQSVALETRPPRIIQPTDEHASAAGQPAAGTSSGGGLFKRAKSKSQGSLFPGILKSSQTSPRSRLYTGSKSKRERAAWEPGVDVHTTNVLLNTPGSTVTITDYAENRYRVARYDVYSELQNDATRVCKDDEDTPHVEFLSPQVSRNSMVSSSSSESSDSSASTGYNSETIQSAKQYLEQVEQSKQALKKALEEPPEWGKVRWVNVNGLSWEAISLIGDHYELHRLAIEDMVDIPQRTKVDIYPNHVFVVMPLLKLVRVRRRRVVGSSWTRRDSVSFDYSQMSSSYSKAGRRRPRFHTLNQRISEGSDTRMLTDSALVPVDKSSKSYKQILDIESRRPLYKRRLGVAVEQMSLFMTLDGTVISFVEHSANDIEKAILPRLSTEYTLLRTSCDPSILLQSIIDASVDLIYPVVTAYNKIINEYEVGILTDPGMQRTDELHLMVNELTFLRSTIQPISASVIQLKDQPGFRRFISTDSALYLSDISDHLISYIQDIDLMSKTIENMLNLVFNTLSVETNTSMQRLSLVTVIFLPLTFWTGYYGMNFENFPDLKRDIAFYWELSVPFCVAIMVIIMRKEICLGFSSLYQDVRRRLR